MKTLLKILIVGSVCGGCSANESKPTEYKLHKAEAAVPIRFVREEIIQEIPLTFSYALDLEKAGLKPESMPVFNSILAKYNIPNNFELKTKNKELFSEEEIIANWNEALLKENDVRYVRLLNEHVCQIVLGYFPKMSLLTKEKLDFVRKTLIILDKTETRHPDIIYTTLVNNKSLLADAEISSMVRRQIQLIEARQEEDKIQLEVIQKQFQKATYADSPVGRESEKQNSKILDTILANAKSMNDNCLLLKKML